MKRLVWSGFFSVVVMINSCKLVKNKGQESQVKFRVH